MRSSGYLRLQKLRLRAYTPFVTKERYFMELDLKNLQLPADSQVRTLTRADAQALGELLWLADQGTVDDKGETLEQAIEELGQTLEGKYGKFLESCSFGFIQEDKIVSASVVTFYSFENSPLVAFAMTHPDFKNRGLCQKLMRQSAQALFLAGHPKCHLAVTAANLPALKAYENIGFKIVKRD